jgi:hypothetical protein
MQQYSHFFSVLHDEPEPVGHIGRGTHYTVARVFEADWICFLDFAIIWDEDHDDRVVWVIERMIYHGLIQPVVAVGERKGCLTVITREPAPECYKAAVERIGEEVPNDCFDTHVHSLANVGDSLGGIIQDDPGKVRDYIAGIDAIWGLGMKPCEFWATTSSGEVMVTTSPLARVGLDAPQTRA